jgi:hypothetical protein
MEKQTEHHGHYAPPPPRAHTRIKPPRPRSAGCSARPTRQRTRAPRPRRRHVVRVRFTNAGAGPRWWGLTSEEAAAVHGQRRRDADAGGRLYKDENETPRSTRDPESSIRFPGRGRCCTSAPALGRAHGVVQLGQCGRQSPTAVSTTSEHDRATPQRDRARQSYYDKQSRYAGYLRARGAYISQRPSPVPRLGERSTPCSAQRDRPHDAAGSEAGTTVRRYAALVDPSSPRVTDHRSDARRQAHGSKDGFILISARIACVYGTGRHHEFRSSLTRPGGRGEPAGVA